MIDPADLAAARALPKREPTPRELAVISALAMAAAEQADTAADAAELLVCAATLLLVREFGPKEAQRIFTDQALVQQLAFANHVQ